jgi:hypothetical protein
VGRFILFRDGEQFEITKLEATLLKKHCKIAWCDTCLHYYPMRGIELEDVEMALAQMQSELAELRCALRETNQTTAP